MHLVARSVGFVLVSLCVKSEVCSCFSVKSVVCFSVTVARSLFLFQAVRQLTFVVVVQCFVYFFSVCSQ